MICAYYDEDIKLLFWRDKTELDRGICYIMLKESYRYKKIMVRDFTKYGEFALPKKYHYSSGNDGEKGYNYNVAKWYNYC